MKLAELKGSEKQINWAFDIRENFINKYEACSDEQIESFTRTSVEAVRKAVNNVLESEQSSKFYIEKIRLAFDIWDAMMLMLEKQANSHLADNKLSNNLDSKAGIVELKDMGDRIQFKAIRYAFLIKMMKRKKAKEIGYNERGQFVWEKEKENEKYTIEVAKEGLETLGYTVYIN